MTLEAHVQEDKATALIADIYEIVGSNRRYWLEFAVFAERFHLQEHHLVKLPLGKTWAKATLSAR